MTTLAVVDLRDAFDIAPPAGSEVDPDQKLLGVPEVAELLGMSERWVYERFRVQVPPVNLGKLKWPTWKVYAYIEANQEQVVR